MITIVRVDVLLVFVGSLIAIFILAPILNHFKKGAVRRIAILDNCLEALRVSAEKGTSLIFGTAGIDPQISASAGGIAIASYFPTLVSLLKTISEKAAELGVKIITLSNQPIMALVQRDVQQRGYLKAGHPELYSLSDNLYFPDYSSYAIGSVDVISRQKPGGAIHIGWSRKTVNAFVYETFSREGTLLVAGEVWPNDNAPAVIGADYISWGEENIVLGAYLSEDSMDQAIVSAEDFIKIFLIGATVAVGILKVLGVM